MSTRVAVLILLSAASAAAFQDVSSFQGKWRLDHERSQDLSAHIKQAAGNAYMSGGPSWATETWIPWSADYSEHARISVREFMLSSVPVFEALEIQQHGDELTTIHGDSGSRIFNLKRASSGSSALSGQTVRREARVEAGQLVLESKGKEGRFRETFTLEEGGNRLIYVLHLEQKLLKSELDVRLVYGREH